ncbi:MAG: short-chain dehydrogenase [Phycisphaeraceae bacterium]|nr:short-chain dehydrogenase [Phycisphaeraceae bacterium]
MGGAVTAMTGFDLSSKTAVICGLSGGVGEETARALARAGAEIIVVEGGTDLARATVESITAAGGRARHLNHDAEGADGIATAFAEIARDHDRVDILVTTANRAHRGTVLETSDEDLETMLDVNVRSVVQAMRHALPLMLAHGGAIVHIASIFANLALKERFAYTLTKGAVVSLTRSMAADYADRNVRCNCVCPARTDTQASRDWVRARYPGREQEAQAALAAFHPLGRMGTPQEVASLILYLCSDAGAFVTGQAFAIDGGVTATVADIEVE